MRIRSIGLATALVALAVAACVGDNPDLDRAETEKDDAGSGTDAGTTTGGDASSVDAGSESDAADAGDTGNIPPPGARIVFVSSAVYTPIDVADGVNAFDALCNTLAAGSPVLMGKRKFRAWMSTSAESAATRTGAPMFVGAYQLVTGTFVANSGADLLDGTLLAPINRDEKGVVQAGKAPWTGTMSDGTLAAGENCGDWRGSSANQVARGSTDATSGAWAKNTMTTCSGDAPIYCFEVP